MESIVLGRDRTEQDERERNGARAEGQKGTYQALVDNVFGVGVLLGQLFKLRVDLRYPLLEPERQSVSQSGIHPKATVTFLFMLLC